MIVLHIHWSLQIGGTENILVDIINKQLDFIEVHLLIMDKDPDDSLLNRLDKRCKLHMINRQKGDKSILSILKMNLMVMRLQPDIVHFHSEGLNKLLFIPCKRIRTSHGMNNRDFKNVKLVTCISQGVEDNIKSWSKVPTVVIENGLNFEAVSKKEHYGKIRNIVQVSRLDIRYKGQDILLKAIGQLVHSYGIKDIKLSFIGYGKDEDMLKALAKELKVSDNIVFLGKKGRAYIYENLCQYDLFVQASRNEGFGLTLLEAIAAKLPVLSSDISGPSSIVQGGKYGVVFKSDDVDDCIEKLLNIVKNGYPLDVETSYEYARQHFSVKNTAIKMIEQYHHLLNIR